MAEQVCWSAVDSGRWVSDQGKDLVGCSRVEETVDSETCRVIKVAVEGTIRGRSTVGLGSVSLAAVVPDVGRDQLNVLDDGRAPEVVVHQLGADYGPREVTLEFFLDEAPLSARCAHLAHADL